MVNSRVQMRISFQICQNFNIFLLCSWCQLYICMRFSDNEISWIRASLQLLAKLIKQKMTVHYSDYVQWYNKWWTIWHGYGCIFCHKILFCPRESWSVKTFQIKSKNTILYEKILGKFRRKFGDFS